MSDAYSTDQAGRGGAGGVREEHCERCERGGLWQHGGRGGVREVDGRGAVLLGLAPPPLLWSDISE